MERRYFLSRLTQGVAANVFGAGKAASGDIKAPIESLRFLSACLGREGSGRNGGFEAALLTAGGQVIGQTVLKMRAHEIALHPSQKRVLATGRQPGRFSTMIDLATGAAEFDLALDAAYEFNGHAVFLGTGEELLATEEHVETSEGRLSFYDSASGRWLRAWSSHGVEPHEALVDVRGNRVIVANGGILQRQSVGEVASSIVVLDLTDGRLIGKTVLPEELNSLSMRHMAPSATGETAIAMQDQDAQSDLRPLVAVMDTAGELRFLAIPRDIAETMRGYIGSVAIDSASRVVCATSPKGNVAMFWSLEDDHWLGTARIADGCGVAPAGTPGAFVVTGGRGDILRVETLDASGAFITPVATTLRQDPGWQWDNHLTMMTA
ncbi:MAG TPA: DUF1513 domain-containing protein [Terriglobales bacterium]|nr:DUF1513 domain-containing protein [Terriglobales bacterium]